MVCNVANQYTSQFHFSDNMQIEFFVICLILLQYCTAGLSPMVEIGLTDLPWHPRTPRDDTPAYMDMYQLFSAKI